MPSISSIDLQRDPIEKALFTELRSSEKLPADSDRALDLIRRVSVCHFVTPYARDLAFSLLKSKLAPSHV